MTDLKKLLYVAKKVWPDRDYQMHRGQILLWCNGVFVPNHLQPHKPTERGKAQLTDIFFALLDDGREDLDISEISVNGIKSHEASVHLESGNYRFGEGKTKAEAIINLASEVL